MGMTWMEPDPHLLDVERVWMLCGDEAVMYVHGPMPDDYLPTDDPMAQACTHTHFTFRRSINGIMPTLRNLTLATPYPVWAVEDADQFEHRRMLWHWTWTMMTVQSRSPLTKPYTVRRGRGHSEPMLAFGHSPGSTQQSA